MGSACVDSARRDGPPLLRLALLQAKWRDIYFFCWRRSTCLPVVPTSCCRTRRVQRGNARPVRVGSRACRPGAISQASPTHLLAGWVCIAAIPVARDGTRSCVWGKSSSAACRPAQGAPLPFTYGWGDVLGPPLSPATGASWIQNGRSKVRCSVSCGWRRRRWLGLHTQARVARAVCSGFVQVESSTQLVVTVVDGPTD